ncbi:hypothetical protein [Pedobacter mucosus]|uniref:hypothetical protein n=1 Tax=Pedobacter mucosus TaxID=2895286 RepID=UPI001EE49FDD|nr:hypothetical protein [Pedobacter mucosus]UKT65687.1 hypothetical protein LOK61_07820 [Pedobacter mucosus]
MKKEATKHPAQIVLNPKQPRILKTDEPLCEKDEVKRAEENLRIRMLKDKEKEK